MARTTYLSCGSAGVVILGISIWPGSSIARPTRVTRERFTIRAATSWVRRTVSDS